MFRIVEMKALPNGAHRNQSYPGFVPGGWAVVPEGMETPNFPFGEVEAAMLPFGEPDPETGEVEKVMTVTKWTPGEMPVPKAPTPTQQREQAYNTQPIVAWEGEVLTVTQAATKWQYYAAEGNAKADELQELIANAKQAIRAQYPDEEESK
jgi:hypothetical protein